MPASFQELAGIFMPDRQMVGRANWQGVAVKSQLCCNFAKKINDMDNKKQPLILISNDDGLQFRGIKVLAHMARQLGEVVVVAPMQHQSGKSSAITLSEPLRAIKVRQEPGLTVYAVNGTPADCAKLALSQLLEDRKPTLMLSGINHGFNMGISTLYSGTMGAAFEGSLHGVPSVAFSLGDYGPDANFDHCLPYVEAITRKVLNGGLPKGVVLNVNMPAGSELKGVKLTATGMGRWVNEFERRVDPHGQPYYWMQGDYEREGCDESTDIYWLDRGWVTVTPCKVDQTAREAMAQIADLIL